MESKKTIIWHCCTSAVLLLVSDVECFHCDKSVPRFLHCICKQWIHHSIYYKSGSPFTEFSKSTRWHCFNSFISSFGMDFFCQILLIIKYTELMFPLAMFFWLGITKLGVILLINLLYHFAENEIHQTLNILSVSDWRSLLIHAHKGMLHLSTNAHLLYLYLFTWENSYLILHIIHKIHISAFWTALVYVNYFQSIKFCIHEYSKCMFVYWLANFFL